MPPMSVGPVANGPLVVGAPGGANRDARTAGRLTAAGKAVCSGGSAQIRLRVLEPERLDVEDRLFALPAPLPRGYRPLVTAHESLGETLRLRATGLSLVKYLFCHRGNPLLPRVVIGSVFAPSDGKPAANRGNFHPAAVGPRSRIRTGLAVPARTLL